MELRCGNRITYIWAMENYDGGKIIFQAAGVSSGEEDVSIIIAEQCMPGTQNTIQNVSIESLILIALIFLSLPSINRNSKYLLHISFSDTNWQFLIEYSANGEKTNKR